MSIIRHDETSPPRPRGLLTGALVALALVSSLAAAVLLAPNTAGHAAAQATDVTVWSATLTVQENLDTPRLGYNGCSSVVAGKWCSDTAILSDDEFIYDDRRFFIQEIYSTGDNLFVRFRGTPTSHMDTHMTLHVGGTALAFTDGDNIAGWDRDNNVLRSETVRHWGSTHWNTTWAQDETVALELTVPAAHARRAIAFGPRLAYGPDPVQIDLVKGNSTYYTVELTTQPTGTVTVTPSSGDTAKLTVPTAALTFTTDDWNQAQTVTVTAANLFDNSDIETITVSHDISGADYASVPTTDLDVYVFRFPGLIFSKPALTVTEGESSTYTVALASAPTTNVTLHINQSDFDLTVTPSHPNLGGGSLTFTTANWNTAQTVTVAAGHDLDLRDKADTLIHVAENYQDSQIHFRVVEDFIVTVIDDDQTLMIIDDAIGTEGNDMFFSVFLDPAVDEVVSVDWETSDGTAKAGSDYTAGSGTLTFRPGDYHKHIKIPLMYDGTKGPRDTPSLTFTLMLENATNAELPDPPSGLGTILIAANRKGGVAIGPQSLSIPAGGEGLYWVHLDRGGRDGQYNKNATVTITSDNGRVTVDPTTLTFTENNWYIAQAVTVSMPDDADPALAATLSHEADFGRDGRTRETDTGPTVAVTVAYQVTGDDGSPGGGDGTGGGGGTGSNNPCAAGFADADSFGVHAEAIQALCAAGITKGCTAEPLNYCPAGAAVTRAQMASFLTRAFNLETPDDDAGFVDADSFGVHADAIEALYAEGITKGCTTEPLRYCPNDPITRAQMASFLTRAFNLETPDDDAGFVDADSFGVHADAIEALYAEGITKGCTTEPLRYCPNDPITRAQMASFLARALKLI